MQHTKSYHPNHPNPHCYRDNIVVLDGEWDFCFDKDNIGLLHHYENGLNNCLKIKVPYPYQSEASGIHYIDEHIDVVWYQKKINIKSINKVERLTFLAVDYHTTLFVNGQFVGIHEGGYDSFSFDIAPFLIEGDNIIVLRVEDYHHIDQIRGKQRWRNDSFECFYLDTTGIVQSVYLEHFIEEYISYFSLRGNSDTKELSLYLETPNKVNTSLELLVYKRGENTVYKRELLNINSTNFYSIILFDDIVCWDNENPYLYDAKLILSIDDVVVDIVETYFGFISYKAKDQQILINNKKTYMRMVLDQGYFPLTLTTPTEKQIINDLNLIIKAGFNGLRKHEKIESPLYYYYLDVLGLYNWQECPSPMEYSSITYKTCFEQWPRIIKDHISHPSIMAYVNFNESWGIQAISRSIEIQDFTVKMYETVKRMVPDRFVISNDGWEHTVSDIITFHNYFDENKEMFDKRFPFGMNELMAGKNVFCNEHKRFFASDRFKYKDQPIMCTEFAGIAYCTNESNLDWGYGDKVKNEDSYLSRYKALLDCYHSINDICGFCMTQLSDVEIEKNGLYTFLRKEKIDISKIKKLHDMFINR